MAFKDRVVKFVESILDASKRTAPRCDEKAQSPDVWLTKKTKTPRQIMSEVFGKGEDGQFYADWMLEPSPDKKLKFAGQGEPAVKAEPRPRAPRPPRGDALAGPSYQRLLKAYEEKPELEWLITEVREGKRSVTDALIEAGIEKPRTRVGNMRANWIRASDEERREFLDLVCDKRLFDNANGTGWYIKKAPGLSVVPDALRGSPTEVKD